MREAAGTVRVRQVQRQAEALGTRSTVSLAEGFRRSVERCQWRQKTDAARLTARAATACCVALERWLGFSFATPCAICRGTLQHSGVTRAARCITFDVAVQRAVAIYRHVPTGVGSGALYRAILPGRADYLDLSAGLIAHAVKRARPPRGALDDLGTIRLARNVAPAYEGTLVANLRAQPVCHGTLSWTDWFHVARAAR